MAVKFDIAEGGFIQDTALNGIEFRITGVIENPDLELISAPSYTSAGLTVSSAILTVIDGRAGSFKIEVRSAGIDGTGEVVHVSETVTLGSSGAYGESLTIVSPNISSGRVVKLYAQHVSGGYSSDVSVTLE